MQICAFLQARMSSRRFPGKVLAPFQGRPLITHVIAAARQGLPGTPVVVVTSVDATDDPLVAYLREIGVPSFRGPLHDVFDRFRAALASFPCDLVVRVCCDSPLLPASVVSKVVDVARNGAWDLVTTTARRTFPKGHNVEVIRSRTLNGIDESSLDDADREHVTRFFHRHPDRFAIKNVESGDDRLALIDHCVDTVEDLTRLEPVRGLA